MPRAARTFSQDRSVVDHKLAPGTIRRILGFARPYRRQLAVFLALVMLDALLGAATPLLYRAIIDQGIVQERTGLVIALAPRSPALPSCPRSSASPSAGTRPVSAKA